MFLSEPSATSYDLNFSLFGFPIRVHPAFFILPLLFGSGLLNNPNANAGVSLLVLMAVFFISILVHELGHAFAFQYYGVPSRVVLYWMGGLAIPDSGGGPWAPRTTVSLRPQQQIVISLAGPIFGFLLAALLMGVVIALRGSISFSWYGIIPLISPHFDNVGIGYAGRLFLWFGIAINVYLNLLNLMPVFPLDGGQVARQLFVLSDPWNGLKHSMMLSIAIAVLIALVGFMSDESFLGIFFGFMAWSNYVTLQQMGGGGFGGGFGGGRPWR